MASTSHSSHGSLIQSHIELHDKIVFAGANDESKTISIVVAEPSTAGNVNLNIAALSQDRDLLHSGSTLQGAQLAAGSVPDSAFENAPNLPTASTEADIVVYDASLDAQAVALSGDATISASGVLTLASNSVDTAQLQSQAVTGIKCSVGFIDNSNKFAANVVNSAAVGAGQITEAKIASNACTKAKIADASTTYGSQEASKLVALDASKNSSGVNDWVCEGDIEAGAAGSVRLGPEAEGNWQFVKSGSNLLIQRFESSVWVTKSTIAA